MNSNSVPTAHCGISDETSPPFIAFFSVCINGANRNYQILCNSLKPSYGNHYLTKLRQASEMTSASFNGFAGGSKCKALLQRLCCELGPATWQCPIVRWLYCSHAEGKHAYPSTPRRPQAKSFFEWGHIIIHACRTPVAVHSVCAGSLCFLRPPEEGNGEFLINSVNHSKENFSSSRLRVLKM